jgi:peroxiredoxin (alkyl hydroperoxide reductase subunit C)
LKQFEEKGAQLIGLSSDPRAALRAWSNSLGGLAHPLLSDFWPHGATLKAYDLFNEEGGTARRSLMVIDKEGIIRHTELHQGTLPDAQSALAELARLQG